MLKRPHVGLEKRPDDEICIWFGLALISDCTQQPKTTFKLKWKRYLDLTLNLQHWIYNLQGYAYCIWLHFGLHFGLLWMHNFNDSVHIPKSPLNFNVVVVFVIYLISFGRFGNKRNSYHSVLQPKNDHSIRLFGHLIIE